MNTEFNKVAKVKFAVDGISSEFCAKVAIDGTLQGKPVIIPGAMLKAGLFFRKFLSEKTMLKIAYGFQRRKNER